MANAIKLNTSTLITFKSTGGSALFTPTSLAQNAGRISAQYDLGVGPRYSRFAWRATSKANATVVIGDTLADIYVSTSDGTNMDGTPGTSDAALSSIEKARNMQWCGALIVEATAVAIVAASGIIELAERYVSIVWINRLSTAVALSSTATDHLFQLLPIFDEIQ